MILLSWDSFFFILRMVLEVGILAIIFYWLVVFLKGTRAFTILLGIILILTTLSSVTFLLQLEVLKWIIGYMWTILPMIMVIVFQNEIRQVFAKIGLLGHKKISNMNDNEKNYLIGELVAAIKILSERCYGSIIAIECNIEVQPQDNYTTINANLTSELLVTIFTPKTMLHDGAVVIHDNKIISAGCVFPLATLEKQSELGTRHRAGVGITEECDAIVLITSEETGNISLAFDGKLKQNLSLTELERTLSGYLEIRTSATRTCDKEYLSQTGSVEILNEDED